MNADELSHVSIFQGVDRDELQQAGKAFSDQRIAAGETICTEGAAADALFILREGKVEVTKAKGQRQRQLAILGPWEFFGEMGVLKGEPRAATVIALEPCLVGRIERDALLKLIQHHPIVGARIRNEIVRRYTENISKLLA